MLSVKYQSPAISKLEGVALVKGIQKALVMIRIITGWALLEDDMALQMFETLLYKKLLADFPTLNLHEIEYAFLHHTTGIRNWGATVNIPLIEEVLNAYIAVRAKVSFLEDQHEVLPEPAPRSLTLAEYYEFAADTERMYNAGTLGTNLLPVMIYNFLVATEDIMLPDMQKKLYYRAARGMVSYLPEPDRTNAALVLAKQIALSKYFDAKKTRDVDAGGVSGAPEPAERP